VTKKKCLIKYKTVLYGYDSPDSISPHKKGDVDELKLVELDECCDNMATAYRNEDILDFADGRWAIEIYRWDSPYHFPISFCPFCGAEIVLVEVKRVALLEKKVYKSCTETVYFEEEI